MKVLFIGGTGNISAAVSRHAISKGIELYHLNRGQTKVNIPGVQSIKGDYSNHQALKECLKDHQWDVVVNWIAFNETDVNSDIDLFRNKTKQYIFISSASAYEKPPTSPFITESTPLINPFWEYSQDKINSENRLMKAYKEENFPVTIVRPSHTYDTVIPVTIGGWQEYTIVDRMKKGQKIIIHGDGTSLWTVTHADDFAVGFNGLFGKEEAIGQAYQITSDESLSWNQIYQSVADAAVVEMNAVHISSYFINKIDPVKGVSLLADKAHSVIFDNTKIKNLVPEFNCTIRFSEGIKRTLAWFEADAGRRLIRPETNQMMDRIIAAYER
jgi:nucleoside-diphosphate-sugar epimerase